MTQSWDDTQRNERDVELALGWRGQDKAFCLGAFWWGGSHFSRKLWFLLLRREYATLTEAPAPKAQGTVEDGVERL